jgi:uracil-DNA glycosylase
LTSMNKEALMTQVEYNVKICKKCRLFETATNPVPGEGNINSKMVFVGEAPGEFEDQTGRPFVGRAGRLLEQMLLKIGYKRSDVWIGNIIKHRPPQNRDPLPDEIAACRGYLDIQLEAIAPDLVVTLGRYSMNYFLPEAKISKDRGRYIKCGKYFIYPVYHPAAALRNPTMMTDFTKDFLQIPKVLADISSADKSSKDFSVGGSKDQPALGL